MGGAFSFSTSNVFCVGLTKYGDVFSRAFGFTPFETNFGYTNKVIVSEINSRVTLLYTTHLFFLNNK